MRRGSDEYIAVILVVKAALTLSQQVPPSISQHLRSFLPFRVSPAAVKIPNRHINLRIASESTLIHFRAQVFCGRGNEKQDTRNVFINMIIL